MKKKIKVKIESHSTKYMTQILDLKKYQGCRKKKLQIALEKTKETD